MYFVARIFRSSHSIRRRNAMHAAAKSKTTLYTRRAVAPYPPIPTCKRNSTIGGGKGQWLGGAPWRVRGSWGQSLQRGPAAELLVRRRSPLEAESILVIGCPTEPANLAPVRKKTVSHMLCYGPPVSRVGEGEQSAWCPNPVNGGLCPPGSAAYEQSAFSVNPCPLFCFILRPERNTKI